VNFVAMGVDAGICAAITTCVGLSMIGVLRKLTIEGEVTSEMLQQEVKDRFSQLFKRSHKDQQELFKQGSYLWFILTKNRSCNVLFIR
jgi:hypothetical protein